MPPSLPRLTPIDGQYRSLQEISRPLRRAADAEGVYADYLTLIDCSTLNAYRFPFFFFFFICLLALPIDTPQILVVATPS